MGYAALATASAGWNNGWENQLKLDPCLKRRDRALEGINLALLSDSCRHTWQENSDYTASAVSSFEPMIHSSFNTARRKEGVRVQSSMTSRLSRPETERHSKEAPKPLQSELHETLASRLSVGERKSPRTPLPSGLFLDECRFKSEGVIPVPMKQHQQLGGHLQSFRQGPPVVGTLLQTGWCSCTGAYMRS